jgi:hypothetical protein
MPKSSTAKGNYYKAKSKLYYESLGYETQLTEFMCGRAIPGGKIFYVKRDVFGSDGISMNGKEIIFWNSKATTEDRKDGVTKMKSEGKVEFEKFPFPDTVKRQVIIWLPKKKPIIVDL